MYELNKNSEDVIENKSASLSVVTAATEVVE